jgi:hypothetical protein
MQEADGRAARAGFDNVRVRQKILPIEIKDPLQMMGAKSACVPCLPSIPRM